MLDLKATTEVHEKLRKLLRNRDWLSQNVKQVQADYGEKWVAIAEEKIIAHGLTSAEVQEQVKGKYPDEEMLVLRIPKEEISRPV